MLVNQNVFVAIVRARIKFVELQKRTFERCTNDAVFNDRNFDGRIRDLVQMVKFIESFPNFGDDKLMGKFFTDSFEELYPGQEDTVQIVGDKKGDTE